MPDLIPDLLAGCLSTMLVIAGIGKLVSPKGAERFLVEIAPGFLDSLDWARPTVRLVAICELAVAAGVILAPGLPAYSACLILCVTFLVVLARPAIPHSGCGCFGQLDANISIGSSRVRALLMTVGASVLLFASFQSRSRSDLMGLILGAAAGIQISVAFILGGQSKTMSDLRSKYLAMRGSPSPVAEEVGSS